VNAARSLQTGVANHEAAEGPGGVRRRRSADRARASAVSAVIAISGTCVVACATTPPTCGEESRTEPTSAGSARSITALSPRARAASAVHGAHGSRSSDATQACQRGAGAFWPRAATTCAAQSSARVTRDGRTSTKAVALVTSLATPPAGAPIRQTRRVPDATTRLTLHLA
jgi:hypothetical protein